MGIINLIIKFVFLTLYIIWIIITGVPILLLEIILKLISYILAIFNRGNEPKFMQKFRRRMILDWVDMVGGDRAKVAETIDKNFKEDDDGI